MRAYLSVLRLRLINGLQYRAAALAGLATQFFWGFILIMVYEAFYSQVAGPQPIALRQLITYIWLQQAFLVLIMFWIRDHELFNLITSGDIAYELCRPCGLYGFWFAKLTAQRLSGALLRCFPLLAVAYLLPEPYRLTLPPDPAAFGLFIVALLLGLVVVVAISMLIYISVFYTMSPAGSMLFFSVLGDFFAGSIIPIPLMPEWLQTIAYLFPFRLTADLPFRIYTGHIPWPEALTGILTQLLWAAVLIGCGLMVLEKALRRVVVQGG
ncbi:MAG: ABC transporter permease [Firmicutes bacterium]|nr:ABC transporter permease [Bacillota bacterium]